MHTFFRLNKLSNLINKVDIQSFNWFWGYDDFEHSRRLKIEFLMEFRYDKKNMWNGVLR